MSRNKSWTTFQGGMKRHSRKSGPGIEHKQGKAGPDLILSTDERAKTFNKNAPDAPRRKVGRSVTWGYPMGGGR